MYFPLKIHSHYSLLLSTLKIDDIIEVAKDRYEALCLTDFTSISGSVEFYKACKKKNIKPMLGCEILVTNDPQNKPSTLSLICKNKSGWKTLLEIVSKSNVNQDGSKYPFITFEELVSFDLKDFICIDGYDGSLFNYAVVKDVRKQYLSNLSDYSKVNNSFEIETNLDECFLKLDYLDSAINHTEKLIGIFGENYYLQVSEEECCSDTYIIPTMLSKVIYEIEAKYALQDINLKIVTDFPVYYKDDLGAIDQRVLLSSLLKTTLSNLSDKIHNGSVLEARLNPFLKSKYFQFHDFDSRYHQEIFDKVEEFDILSQPKLPHFKCPNGQNEIEYLKHLTREGWKKLLKPSGKIDTKEKENIYRDRVLQEFEVIEKANLAGYYLIVQDYINEFRNKGYLIGPGRGSIGGSLVAYLIGITLVDSVEFELLFSRFYDSSRVVAGKISLPDIDVDFPPEIRDQVIAYLRDKYGPENVAQIATYGRMQGRSALKEVLRANNYCSFSEMNNITACLPMEGAISDQLEDMDEPSVILWALEHEADKLRNYCILKDGKLSGDYSKAFEQAIRIEGINKNLGKHAAAVIISSEPIVSYCPIVRSTSGEDVIGFDMYAIEDAGGVKVDILGLSALSVVQNVCEEI